MVCQLVVAVVVGDDDVVIVVFELAIRVKKNYGLSYLCNNNNNNNNNNSSSRNATDE